jgi:hypothetical protein
MIPSGHSRSGYAAGVRREIDRRNWGGHEVPGQMQPFVGSILLAPAFPNSKRRAIYGRHPLSDITGKVLKKYKPF